MHRVSDHTHSSQVKPPSKRLARQHLRAGPDTRLPISHALCGVQQSHGVDSRLPQGQSPECNRLVATFRTGGSFSRRRLQRIERFSSSDLFDPKRADKHEQQMHSAILLGT